MAVAHKGDKGFTKQKGAKVGGKALGDERAAKETLPRRVDETKSAKHWYVPPFCVRVSSRDMPIAQRTALSEPIHPLD